jgi:hypothetical protein
MSSALVYTPTRCPGNAVWTAVIHADAQALIWAAVRPA